MSHVRSEIVRTTERTNERRRELRAEHPEIEGDTFGDVVPKCRALDPEFDRLCARRESLVREYHETWKAMLDPEQQERLPR